MPAVTLTISPSEHHSGYYLVVVNGEGFGDSVNASVGARIRGDDQWFDDHLLSIGGAGFDRVQFNGEFSLVQSVPGSVLNEDWGRDEIYALVDVEGKGTFKTNKVTGHF